MSSNFSTIKSYIKTKLEGINGLKYVYNYEKGDLSGYPACTIVGVSVISPLEDTCNNLREYVFKIRIFQEINENSRGADSAESIIDNLVDEVINKFDEDYHLGGNVEMSGVTATLGWVDRELAMRVFELDLTCKKLTTV
jgi:hypothetical protein